MHSKVASDDEAWGQSYGIAVLAGVFGVRAHRWGVQHSGNHVIAGVCVHITSDYEICETFHYLCFFNCSVGVKVAI